MFLVSINVYKIFGNLAFPLSTLLLFEVFCVSGQYSNCIKNENMFLLASLIEKMNLNGKTDHVISLYCVGRNVLNNMIMYYFCLRINNIIFT